MPSKMIQTAITVCISSTKAKQKLTASNPTYTCTMNFLQLVIARKLISTLTQIKASIHNTADIDSESFYIATSTSTTNLLLFKRVCRLGTGT